MSQTHCAQELFAGLLQSVVIAEFLSGRIGKKGILKKSDIAFFKSTSINQRVVKTNIYFSHCFLDKGKFLKLYIKILKTFRVTFQLELHCAKHGKICISVLSWNQYNSIQFGVHITMQFASNNRNETIWKLVGKCNKIYIDIVFGCIDVFTFRERLAHIEALLEEGWGKKGRESWQRYLSDLKSAHKTPGGSLLSELSIFGHAISANRKGQRCKQT